MCKLASFVVTRERVLWHPESDSHEKIIEKYNLDDKKESDFVRVEIAPPQNDYLLPLDKWEYKVDQQRTPEWYSKRNAEEAVREELAKWRKKRQWFFDAMDFVATIKDVKWFSHKGKELKKWRVFDTRAAADAAAGAAAYAAAGAAALLSRCIVVADKIDPKHMTYARARWDVWVRGYGLLCDVSGVLYVYRKP